MTKHYKRFGIALLLLGGAALFLFAFRSHLPFYYGSGLDYEKEVRTYAKKYDLDPALVFAVIKTESNFDPNAVSSKKAYGLMQITEETLNWALFRENAGATYTAEDLFDPAINIKYGCLILSLFSEEFQDTDTALAAYNAGRSNAIKWLKDSRYSEDGVHIKATPYKETNEYIKKVQNHYQKYQEMLGENK